ncbi:DUF4349 domain-containing protein [Streptomyces sp. RKAG293]|uniref:DUF4349 domain-containing protein n=1 Tax=Streptomyces sp. RKAG293 TaxID=2893403 RepID=UPI0020336D78|nr:DUF4349 domain-containing protein [Streptomyces sp. RKAG293]MCM2422217.1 DUF4349 domain-containing protein [Streptomyces sp. RKAG293]
MRQPTTIRRRPFAALAAAALTAVLTVSGCGASGSSNDSKADKAAAAPQQADARGAADAPSAAPGTAKGATTKTPAPSQNYVVRTATLSVEAKDGVAAALVSARTLVTGAGGYIGDENTSRDGQGLEHSTITLRVPPESYDKVLNDLAGLGRLIERKVSTEDVTGQVVDVESRIRSQQASLARVRELMNRTTQLSDVVTLEGELSTREANLEALQAQQASLKERTNLATVSLVLSEPEHPASAPPKKDDGFWESVGNALGTGWHAFYVALRGILIVLSVALPFAALGLAGWFVFVVVRRRLSPSPRVVREKESAAEE